MALQLRQPIEGDKVISAQGFTEGCHVSSGSYVHNSLSFIINSVEYPINSVLGFGFGFVQIQLPIPLKRGDTIQIKSNCSSDISSVFDVIPTDFIVKATNATICNNTTPVTVEYKDVIKLFLENQNSHFYLYRNNLPVEMSDFQYQQHTTGSFTISSGYVTGVVATLNETAFSSTNYSPTTTLKIEQPNGYFTIRLGVIEIICSSGSMQYTNFATGQVEQSLTTYLPTDVIEIESTGSEINVYKNTVQIYTYNVEVQLTPSGGTISPSTISIGNTSTWTLPTSPGTYTITAVMGTGAGVETKTDIQVTNCKATADNKTVTVTRGTTNNAIPTLTGTVPTNCSDGGFRIESLPSCGTAKLSGTPLTIGQIVSTANAGNIKFDIPSSCLPQNYTLTYRKILSLFGCDNSDIATVTIQALGCLEDWQDTPDPQRCESCVRQKRQRNVNFNCSGGPEFRWVNTGDNILCLEPTWQDIPNSVRCNNCQEEKEQRNINTCVSVVNRWVPNPGGNQCNLVPNFQPTSPPTCINCKTYVTYTDVSPCSPTNGNTELRLQEINICNTIPNWVTTNAFDCINCVEKEYFIDLNPCSPTFQDTQMFDNPTGNNCNTTPNYITTENKRCNGEIEEVARVNTNPCYSGTENIIWVPTGEICFCEKVLRVKNICGSNSDIIGVIVRRTDSPAESNRLIEFTNEKIKFKASPVFETYTITLEDSKHSLHTITMKTRCEVVNSGDNKTVKYGYVHYPNVTASNINNSDFNTIINSGEDFTCFFNYSTPAWLFMAEPIEEPEKTKWWENSLNNENIAPGNAWKVYGNVGGYRVYITSYQTYFNSPITFKIS